MRPCALGYIWRHLIACDHGGHPGENRIYGKNPLLSASFWFVKLINVAQDSYLLLTVFPLLTKYDAVLSLHA